MLSVIIPARNEVFLQKTIDSILSAAEGEIEVIAILDGYWPNPPIKDDPRVTLIHHSEPIGQRASVNKGARVARGKYILKTDAHSMFDQGFDRKLKEDCEYDWTVIPRMYVLDHEKWEPKWRKKTDFMYIRSPHIKDRPLRAFYLGDGETARDFPHAYRAYKKATWREGDICDVMTGNGACFFMHKDRFWELGGMDEDHGSWGQMGVEVALKAWLSGGSQKVNKKTWFAHMFHTKGNMFPYKMSGRAQQKARDYSVDFWMNEKWPLQKRPLSWLVDKFSPVPSWGDSSDMTILYYTANVVEKGMEYSVLRNLRGQGLPIVSVSQKPMPDLGCNIVVPQERSLKNIYKQVLIAAKAAKTKYVALCEDDCLYVPAHFKHRPVKPFAYNLNRWNLHLDEKVFGYWERVVLSQCVANREALIECLENGNGRDHEFGRKKDGIEYETFRTEEPNLVFCSPATSTGGRRKLVGKDAEPREEVQPWGTAAYWVNKFEGRRRRGMR